MDAQGFNLCSDVRNAVRHARPVFPSLLILDNRLLFLVLCANALDLLEIKRARDLDNTRPI